MKDKLDNFFKDHEGQFDIETPDIGHFDRFESKLSSTKKTKRSWSKTYSIVAVAASIVLLFGVWMGTVIGNTNGMELANISTEMEETQNYFITTISNELKRVEGERTEDTETVINDAMTQMTRLETAYNQLTLELKENTDDQRIIMAMIDNFQQRIEILKTLLNQIEDIKTLKTQNNEKYV